jgi:cytochrome c2
MKLVSKSTAVLAPILFALAACGGDDADDAATGTGADTTEAAVPSQAATPVAGETPGPEAAPSETPSPTPTPSASRSASAPLAVTEPASFAQCKACHSVEPGKNGIGPSLAGIFGDRAATVPGFEFSDAMKSSGLTWNQATLDRYLTDPKGVVPGTKMAFGGVKDAAKRQEIINYLKAI